MTKETSMSINLRAIIRHIADLCFPVLCFGCDAPGEWLCASCRIRIPLRLEQRCPSCRKRITPSGETCLPCSEKYALSGLFAATYYRVPVVSRALHACKYRFLPDIALPLAEVLASAIDRNGFPLPDIIIPVPLHPRRLRFRGFNQSSIIARHLMECIAPGLDIPILEETLIRCRHTRPQMKTKSRKERLHNLDKAFALVRGKKKDILGKDVWLIDDVATTGATLEACAKVLKKAGARSVFGIVVAR
jgi:ComF family protein